MSVADRASTRLALGRLLQARRRERGLTQEELAERTGAVSVATVAAVENGRSRPYRTTLDLLVAALQLPAAERIEVVQAWRSAAVRADPPTAPWSAGGAPVPARLTPLIGRDADVDLVGGLLARDDVRLVTLVGPGGVGKTSVAAAVAELPEIRRAHPGGTAWVDLSAVRDPQQVLPTVAAVLGLRESGDLPVLARLAAHLGSRDLLLVLDNCEQVRDCGTEVVRLLQLCPRLVVLTTSRGAFRIRGEHVVAVEPLDVPDGLAALDPRCAVDVPVVRLFLDRARAADPGFQLRDTDLPAVADICLRLDGLPLALELATARLAVFTPVELGVRLRCGSEALSNGPRDLPARQRTLRETLEWSYQLLSGPERTLFARLAVFAGGCAVEAVEAVCAGGAGAGDQVPAGSTAGLLEALQSLSLLSVRDGRIRLLETVRDFALGCLTTAELELRRERHLQHYLAVAEAGAAALPGVDRAAWLDRLGAERDNLRAAFGFACGSPDRTLTARLCAALGWFWYFGGPLSEARAQLELALARLPLGSADRLRATCLWHAGRLAHLQGDDAQAYAYLSEAERLWRQDGRSCELAYTLTDLGQVVWFLGRDGCRGPAEESVRMFRECGDRWGLGLALQDLGQVLISVGDLPAARAVHEENLSIFSDLLDGWGQGLALLGLARVEMAEGNLDVARALLAASRTRFERAADPRLLAFVLIRSGQLERRTGDTTQAAAAYATVYRLWSELGNQFGAARAVAGLAGVAVQAGRPEQAAVLSGVADATFQRIGRALSGPDQREDEACRASVRTALGDRFEALDRAGHRLAPQEVAALVAAAAGAPQPLEAPGLEERA